MVRKVRWSRGYYQMNITDWWKENKHSIKNHDLEEAFLNYGDHEVIHHTIMDCSSSLQVVHLLLKQPPKFLTETRDNKYLYMAYGVMGGIGMSELATLEDARSRYDSCIRDMQDAIKQIVEEQEALSIRSRVLH
jgi:hypothetical protein